MRKTLTGMLLLLLCLPMTRLFSQKDFAPGFIISLQNDTVRGLINQKNIVTSSHSCFFKTSPDSPETKYSAGEIRQYGLYKGKLYVSKTVPEHGDSSAVFLEYLVDGIADLYFYRGTTKDR